MDSRAIEETAARWFARRESGAWSESDQADLDAWLAAATAHRIEYLRVQAAWQQAARLRALGAGVPAGVIPPRGSWGNIRFLFRRSASLDASVPVGEASNGRRRVGVFSAAAASVALAVGVVMYGVGAFSGTRYATPVGGTDNVSLDDGSRLTLNTDTRIRVLLTGKERRIQLDRGEAFFEVAKDAARPFVVYAGSQRVMAVGTKFSVRRERDDVQVVVTEGRVSLAAQATEDAGGRAGSASIAMPPPTLLSAGAVARTSQAQVLVRAAATAEAEKLLSWRSGYLIFDNATIAEAVAEFNRYTRRRIVIEDPAIAGLRIGGNFRSNNSDAFLWLLQRGFPIQIEQDEHEVILKAR